MRSRIVVGAVVVVLLVLNAVVLLQKDSFAQDRTVEERLKALEDRVAAIENDFLTFESLLTEIADEIALLGVKTTALEDAVEKM